MIDLLVIWLFLASAVCAGVVVGGLYIERRRMGLLLRAIREMPEEGGDMDG